MAIEAGLSGCYCTFGNTGLVVVFGEGVGEDIGGVLCVIVRADGCLGCCSLKEEFGG